MEVAIAARSGKNSSKRVACPASNAFREGLVSAGIFVLLATPANLALTAYRVGGWGALYERLGVPETLGRVSGQFTVFAILLSVLLYLRKRVGTTGFIFWDWKWWAIAIGLCLFPAKPIVNWLGVSLIYQYRERRRRANQASIISV
jgi:hypothetical protein